MPNPGAGGPRACPRCARRVGRWRLTTWFLRTRWACRGCGATLGFRFEPRDRLGRLLWLGLAGVVAAAAWLGLLQRAPWATALFLPVYLAALVPFLRVRSVAGPERAEEC